MPDLTGEARDGAALWLMTLARESTLENMARVGDSSAVLGTWFSGLAFVILMVTLHLQWQELGLQREELKATREIGHRSPTL